MADLTALDMAKVEAQDIRGHIETIITALFTPLESGQIDCGFISSHIRDMRSMIDRMADAIYTTNREQKGSDEAIQKRQMLYRKEQERIAREARERAEQEALKPVPFSLD